MQSHNLGGNGMLSIRDVITANERLSFDKPCRSCKSKLSYYDIVFIVFIVMVLGSFH